MKFLLVVFGFIATLTIVAFYKPITYRYFFWSITPTHAFDLQQAPPEPDYADADSWFAKPDGANLNKIDVFFLHPTTFRDPKHWNENIYNTDNSEGFLWIGRNILDVFDECCRLYMPFYRQATLAAYWDNDNGPKARQIAYEDVKRAFSYYIQHYNHGRPFILAGHSQGSEMGIRLIQDKILATETFERMIAAYIIGISIPRNELVITHHGFQVCESSSDTHCLVNWTTFRREDDEEYFRMGPNGWWMPEGYRSKDFDAYVCVNPLNWTSGNKDFVSKENHKGMKIYQDDGSIIKLAQQTSAQCGFDGLKVENLDDYLPISLQGNYHMYDYAIFNEDVRRNLQDRIDAYTVANGRLMGQP